MFGVGYIHFPLIYEGKSTLRHHQRIIGIERANVHVFENTYVCIVSDVNTMDEAHLRLGRCRRCVR